MRLCLLFFILQAFYTLFLGARAYLSIGVSKYFGGKNNTRMLTYMFTPMERCTGGSRLLSCDGEIRPCTGGSRLLSCGTLSTYMFCADFFDSSCFCHPNRIHRSNNMLSKCLQRVKNMSGITFRNTSCHLTVNLACTGRLWKD